MPRHLLGCTGWGYDDWRGGFYPPGTPPAEYLARYARVFSLTEVDSTYYRAPTREMVARWAATTPGGFRFTLKVPGEITHKAKLRDVEEALDRFLLSLVPLRQTGKLGPLVLQLPASFRRDKDEDALHAFLARWPRDVRLAVELRDTSWWTNATYRALEDARAALVWSVNESGRTPPARTADFVYARLIGDRTLTRFDRIQRDHMPEVRYWKARLDDEGRDAELAYVLINNHFMGHAPATAARVAETMGLPAPDLQAARRLPGQRSLLDAYSDDA